MSGTWVRMEESNGLRQERQLASPSRKFPVFCFLVLCCRLCRLCHPPTVSLLQRASVQLDGPVFAQTRVFTWMQKPDASYSRLRHTAASRGGHVSNQALEQRFGAASRQLMRAL